MILEKTNKGKIIWLLTLEEFDALPNGTRLISIHDKEVVKGKDYIDDEDRFGYIAFGLAEEDKNNVKII